MNARTSLIVAAALVAVSFPESIRAQAVRLRPLTTPVYQATDGGAVASPGGLSCTGDGFLVADGDRGSVLRYRFGDDAILPDATYRSEAITYPVRAERLGRSAELLVLDGRQHRLGRVRDNGEFLGWVEFSGIDGQVLVHSFRIADDGRWIVLDSAGARVLVAAEDGTVSREIALPAGAGVASDVAVDPTGRILAVDGVRGAVYAAALPDATMFPLAEGLNRELDFAGALAVAPSGTIFVVDRHGGGIVALEPDGTFGGRQSGWGWKLGRLRYPDSACVAGNRLVVSDRGNRRVQVFEIRE